MAMANRGDYHFDPITNEYRVWDGQSWIPVSVANNLGYDIPGVSRQGMPITRQGMPITGVHTSAPNVFQVNTPSGPIKANLETGEVDIPPGLHRSSALWEFWQGFKQIYQPSSTELDLAKQEVAYLKQKMNAMHNDVSKQVAEKLVDRVKNKYGKEKFIMTKPDDLIKLLEEA